MPAGRSVERIRHLAGVPIRCRVGGAGRSARCVEHLRHPDRSCRRLRDLGDPVSRVLVTGGAGMIGSAVVRRLLQEPSWAVAVADHRRAPEWMAERCEIRVGDLRDPSVARTAVSGCTHVIHLAAIVGGIANFHKLPFTLTEVNNALTGALVHDAIDQGVERFVYVSSSMVFERATEFPT